MAFGLQRDAGLSLRDPSGIVRVRVSWPVAASGERTPVLVFLSGRESSTEAADALCRALCAEAALVVLSVRTANFDVAVTALEWTADHAAQLGADPRRLLVGGMGTGAGLAAAAALHARDHEWPALTRQVLVRPHFSGLAGASFAGVAPATVVGAPLCAARLRDAGVDVEELHAIGGLAAALGRSLDLSNDDYEEVGR